jgi:hypothetical protein
MGVYALRTIRGHFSGQQLVLPCASSQSQDEASRVHAENSPTGVMAERARIVFLVLHSLRHNFLSNLLIMHAPLVIPLLRPVTGAQHRSPAHSHTDGVPACHAAGRYHTAAHGPIDDDRTEHAVGCADMASGAGVDWVGCGVDEDRWIQWRTGTGQLTRQVICCINRYKIKK